MTAVQKTIVGAALVAAVGTGIYQAREAASLRSELEGLERQQAPLALQIEQLSRERDDAATGLSALRHASQNGRL
jgi:hypothetical protein